MDTKEFLERALFHIHGILSICGFSCDENAFFIAAKYHHLIQSGHSLYPEFPVPAPTNQNYARTVTSENIVSSFLEFSRSNICSMMHEVYSEKYDKIIRNLTNLHTILLDKNTDPIEVKLSMDLYSGIHRNKITDKIAANTMAGVRYRALHELRMYQPFDYDLTNESISYYIKGCVDDENIPRELIHAAFTQEEINNSVYC